MEDLKKPWWGGGGGGSPPFPYSDQLPFKFFSDDIYVGLLLRRFFSRNRMGINVN